MIAPVREPASALEIRRALFRLAALEARVNSLPVWGGGGGGVVFEWVNTYRVRAVWSGDVWVLVETGGFEQVWPLVHGVFWPLERVEIVDEALGTFRLYDEDGALIPSGAYVEAIVRRTVGA